MIDLGAWASDRYVIAGKAVGRHFDDQADDQSIDQRDSSPS
jgi:endogenous inhibitor of DNA gyrase (YacG/DUF329 family)